MSRASKKKRLRRKIRILWNKPSFIKFYWINKFLKCLLKKGKTELTLNNFFKSSVFFKKETMLPLFLFFESFEKAKPAISLRYCRKGQHYYQIPFLVRNYKLYRLGIKWIALAINDKSSRSKFKNSERIYGELRSLLSENSGKVIKKLKLTYDISIENRAKTHFRWVSSY